MPFPGRKYQRGEKNRDFEGFTGFSRYQSAAVGHVQPLCGNGAALGGNMYRVHRKNTGTRAIVSPAGQAEDEKNRINRDNRRDVKTA